MSDLPDQSWDQKGGDDKDLNDFKARAYLATTVTTALATYAFAAPHNKPN